MSKIVQSTLIAVVLLLAAAHPKAQGPARQAPADRKVAAALPDAKEIVNRHIEAIGGRDVLLSHSSRHVTGTLAMPSAGITGSFELFEAKPNKSVMRMSLPGVGEMSEGFDGEVAWSVNFVTGPAVLEGKQLEEKRLDADFYGDLNLEKRYSSIQTVGRVEFNGRPCYKVSLTRRGGGEDIHYYDVDTGLRAGSEVTRETPLGSVSATVIESDYKRFGKVLYPTKVTNTAMNLSQILTILRVEFDTVDPSEFELPAAIKALVK